MVDNILQEGQEVGFSSGEDGDLSGDEVKAPIFVIKKDQEESKEPSGAGTASMEDDEDIDSEEANELFVQEEYDLANNLDQIVTRMQQFDEYKFIREKATACHQSNFNFFQSIVNEGLSTPKQRDYLKQILQSQRVLLESSAGE